MNSLSNYVRFALFLLLSCFVVTTAQSTNSYKVSEEQVKELLHRLEERLDSFSDIVEIVMEISRLDETPREDRLDSLVNEFESAVDVLQERFDKRISTTTDVQRVLGLSTRMDKQLLRMLRDRSLHPDPSLRERAQTEWSLLKSALSNLADFYKIDWHWGDMTPAAGKISRPASSLVNPAVDLHSDELTIYTVKAGDTLSLIADRFGLTVAAILAANPGVKDPARIFVRQRLTIPRLKAQ